MVEQKPTPPTIAGPLINILLTSLKKVVGPSYEQMLEATSWRRYLKHPPSADPHVAESTEEELGQVFAHIYQVVGKDLFIAFGRYAALDSGKVFAAMMAPAVTPALVGLTGVARLQRMVTLERSLLPWDNSFSVSNTADGIEVTNHNCGLCSRIKSDEPVCAFMADGMRNSYTRIGGYSVVVKETACRAQGKGTDCVFKVTLS
jgi:hypothetical protein